MATEEKSLETSITPSTEGKEPSLEEKIEEKPADLTTLQETIVAQNNLLLVLTKKIESLEKHQDTTDTAIISVAKRVGEGGGGGGLVDRLLPILLGSRGPGPLEKIAMKSFLENIAFTTLTTRRIARKAFGDEYTKMVKTFEGELSGAGGEGEGTE